MSPGNPIAKKYASARTKTTATITEDPTAAEEDSGSDV
jgi:hypothetical protein